MSDILNMLGHLAQGDNLKHISGQLGADEGATQKAISGALPMLVGALAKNASSSGGAESLFKALTRDHDGSALEDVQQGLGLGTSGVGDGILGHMLGGRRGTVENGIGKMSGLDAGSAGKLLAMLAPMVMGALGKQQRSQGLDIGGLASMLGQEKKTMERQNPNSMGMLGKLLDADGDGDMMDDVARMGMGFLGKMLNKR